MKRRRLIHVVCTAVFAIFLLGTIAHAQTDDEQARTHFHSGQGYFTRGEYEDAAREFEAAYRLSGRAVLLLNIANAHERTGNYDDAANAITEYIETLDPADEGRVALIHRRDKLLERAERERERIIGSEPPEEPSSESSKGLGALGYIGIGSLGVGVLSVVAGGIIQAKNKSIHADLLEMCEPTRECHIEGVQSKIDRGNRLNRAGSAMFITGGLLAAAGAALLTVGLIKDSNSDDGLSFRPHIVGGPGDLGLGLAWSLR
jgi:tetratricopeptide (TPR) repeat protein